MFDDDSLGPIDTDDVEDDVEEVNEDESLSSMYCGRCICGG